VNGNYRIWVTNGLLLLLTVAGCQGTRTNTTGLHRPGTPPMREVSGHTFELEYNAPRTRFCQWRYRGIEDGCHVMDFYGVGNGDEPVWRSSIRTPRSDLAKDFPKTPQKPVMPFFTREDDKYFEMMQEEERRDRQRSGDNGIVW
jgi:hypothetical protein